VRDGPSVVVRRTAPPARASRSCRLLASPRAEEGGKPGRPVLQLGGVQPPLPHTLAQNPGAGEQHIVVGHVVDLGDLNLRPGRDNQVDQADGEQEPPHRYTHNGEPMISVNGQRVQGEVHR
jgi:hypothetical protein